MSACGCLFTYMTVYQFDVCSDVGVFAAACLLPCLCVCVSVCLSVCLCVCLCVLEFEPVSGSV